jgi:hypothetical protein
LPMPGVFQVSPLVEWKKQKEKMHVDRSKVPVSSWRWRRYNEP